MASEASRLTAMPALVPRVKTALRPRRRAMAPAGRVATAVPTTKIETGRVASPGEGARIEPTIAPVVMMTVEFAPANACASARRNTLARAMRSFSGPKDSACIK